MAFFRKIRDFCTDNFSSHKPYTTKEGYKQVYRPGSSSARSNGYAPEHRYNAENTYGTLGNKVVHHKDGNKLNNTSRNLQVMSKQEHDRHHGYSWRKKK